MAGLNCKIGKSYLKGSGWSNFNYARASYGSPPLDENDKYYSTEKTCLGEKHCNLDATSFGDECKTCKTIQ